jgi:hypothetical protein
MNTNSKQSTDKTHSGAVCRIIGVLFGLFAFILLPTPEVDASLLLISPPNGTRPVPDSVTVFRWTRSENLAVDSYRLEIADDEEMQNIVLQLPKPGDSPIIAPQVAVDLRSDLSDERDEFEGDNLYWRVIGLDLFGDPLEPGQQIFLFSFITDDRGFTTIKGLVISDRNQLSLAGARVAVLGSHAQTDEIIAFTDINGEYLVIALTTVNGNEKIPFPIVITSTKEGFKPTKVNLPKTEKKTIIRDLEMEIKGDSGDSEGDNLGALPSIQSLLLSD